MAKLTDGKPSGYWLYSTGTRCVDHPTRLAVGWSNFRSACNTCMLEVCGPRSVDNVWVSPQERSNLYVWYESKLCLNCDVGVLTVALVFDRDPGRDCAWQVYLYPRKGVQFGQLDCTVRLDVIYLPDQDEDGAKENAISAAHVWLDRNGAELAKYPQSWVNRHPSARGRGFG